MRHLLLASILAAGCGTGLNGDDAGTGDMTMLPAHCSNGLKDVDESDVDCGGSCAPCIDGKMCQHGSDCASGVCGNNACASPSCTDGIKNGFETDVDCGGGLCPGCAIGKTCAKGSDCTSTSCTNNLCTASQCTDGMRDGKETDVDCGGGTCAACADGRMCLGGGDCASGQCTNNVCLGGGADGGAGDMSIACMAPMANCDGDPMSGCNVNLSEDPSNCGACGMVCPMNMRACVGGKCKSVACPNGLTFAMPVDYPANLIGVSLGLIASDLNGDGRADLAFLTPQSNVVSVFVNKGGGTFGVATDYAIGKQPLGLAVADFDGNGKPDLAIGEENDNTFSLLFNQGNGVFGGRTDYSVAGQSQPFGVAAADFNGDGKIDLAVAGYGLPKVLVFLNQGGGKFGQSTAYDAPPGVSAVVAADLNADGKPDVVSIDGFSTVSIYLNAGNGGLAPRVDYKAVGQQTVTPRIADMNGDGKPDVVVGAGNGMVSIFPNDGTGALGARTDLLVGGNQNDSPTGIDVRDLDGDGRTDLAVTGGNWGSVLVNKGGGVFGAAISVAGNLETYNGVTIADVNGDGKFDLAVDRGPGGAAIIINTCK